MPSFKGVSHVSLSVTDLDQSEAFYTQVLGFMLLMDFGDIRTLLHRSTSFQIALIRHPEGTGRTFTELNAGLDHLGLIAETRAELEEWVTKFDEAEVSYTPIQDMPFGAHLNFRDPDGIPLEFFVPNDIVTAGYRELRERDVPREEIIHRVQEALEGSA